MDGDKVPYPDSVRPISNEHRYLMEMKRNTLEVYKSMPFGDILANVYLAA